VPRIPGAAGIEFRLHGKPGSLAYRKKYLTVLVGLSTLDSSQGGVALRRGVVNTEILFAEGFPGAPGACRKTGTSKTFAAMAEIPLSKTRPFVLAG
jgi:hypothetical protein